MEKVDILIQGCAILPMNRKTDLIRDGVIAVERGKIAYVGERSKNEFRGEVEIEGKGRVALPGLINCHTHVPMTLLRGAAEDLPLKKWLGDIIWPLEQKLRPNDIYYGALLGCLEMIRHGVTAFSDMYFHEELVAKAVQETGIRGILAPGLLEALDPEEARTGFKETITLARKFNAEANGLIRVRFGPHAAYTCSPEFLRQIREAATQNKIGIHIHLAESEEMIKEVRNKHGTHPVELLDEIDFLGPDVLAAHCIYLGKEEVKMLSRHGVKVSYNPVGNMKLAQGIAPVVELLKAGVTVGLGTDGPASNNTLDLLRDARIAALVQKISHMDPTVLPAKKVLEMATRDGAEALGLGHIVGILEPGKRADLILLDFMKPHLRPIHDFYANTLYSSSGADVETVIIDGKVVLSEGKIRTVDEHHIIEEVSKMALDLVSR